MGNPYPLTGRACQPFRYVRGVVTYNLTCRDRTSATADGGRRPSTRLPVGGITDVHPRKWMPPPRLSLSRGFPTRHRAGPKVSCYLETFGRTGDTVRRPGRNQGRETSKHVSCVFL